MKTWIKEARPVVLAAGLLSTLAMVPADARAASATARLEPQEIARGEAATLIVTTDETDSEPVLPRIPGLHVQEVGRQTQMTSVNGQAESSTSYIYRVSADRTGDVVIDGISVDGARADALTLHVTDARSTAGATAPPAAFSAGAPVEESEPPAAREDAARRAFLRLNAGKKKLYAGESVPFTAQAYFRADTGVTITGAPTFTSDVFTVSGLDEEPKQTRTTVRGEPYLVVTWRGVLTAAKPGAHRLEATLPVSLQYREQGGARAAPGRTLRDLFGGSLPMGSLFDDPMFDALLDQSAFAAFAEPGRVVSRDLTLRTDGSKLSVQGLPEAGRPADFSGAIGEFELSASLADRTLIQGEPTDLNVEIRGRGNFGRFTPSGLSSNAEFRAYAPSSTFVAERGSEIVGKLALVQPVAAQRAGDLELPPVHFSYFDPSAGRYVTKSSAPISVRAAAGGVASAAPGSTRATSEVPAESEHALSVQSLRDAGVPTWLWPTVLTCLSLSGLGALVLTARRSTAYRHATAALASRRRSRSALVAMRRAARDDDATAFLAAARRAVQERLATTWGLLPERISLSDLDARWPSAPAAVREVFEADDEARYGDSPRATPERGALVSWATQLDRQLKTMEVPS